MFMSVKSSLQRASVRDISRKSGVSLDLKDSLSFSSFGTARWLVTGPTYSVLWASLGKIVRYSSSSSSITTSVPLSGTILLRATARKQSTAPRPIFTVFCSPV